jgi:hypothetical protein
MGVLCLFGLRKHTTYCILMLQEEPGIIINYILEICMPQYTVQKYKEASDVNISLKEH